MAARNAKNTGQIATFCGNNIHHSALSFLSVKKNLLEVKGSNLRVKTRKLFIRKTRNVFANTRVGRIGRKPRRNHWALFISLMCRLRFKVPMVVVWWTERKSSKQTTYIRLIHFIGHGGETQKVDVVRLRTRGEHAVSCYCRKG